MADLTMNTIIHTAVRRDLARMHRALGAFPAGDHDRARALQRAWRTLWNQLRHHHVSEDTYVWPYLRSLGPDAIDPSVLQAMEDEHEAMSRAMQDVTAAVDGLASEPTAERAAAAASAVAHTTAVTDRHLVHEENEVMPVIVARDHTPEWKAVEKQLRTGGPFLAGELMAWLQDGAEPHVVAALRKNVPPPVLFVLSRGFGRAYHREVAPVWR